jgi:hypothetical protein
MSTEYGGKLQGIRDAVGLGAQQAAGRLSRGRLSIGQVARHDESQNNQEEMPRSFKVCLRPITMGVEHVSSGFEHTSAPGKTWSNRPRLNFLSSPYSTCCSQVLVV